MRGTDERFALMAALPLALHMTMSGDRLDASRQFHVAIG